MINRVAGYKYDLAAMDSFLADIDSRIAALTDKHAEVQSTVTSLADTYVGEAADAHREAHGHWQQTATAHIEELKKLRDQVALARRNYADAQRANREMFGWDSK